MVGLIGLFLIVQAARANWMPVKRLTWTPGSSGYPAITVDSSDNIHLVWQDDTSGSAEIYYKRRLAGSAAWSTSKQLTWTADRSSLPAIASDSTNAVHVVWAEGEYRDQKIFYKKSSDGGDTWTRNKRLSGTSGSARWPALAVDPSGGVHVLWEGETLGSQEIYYARSLDGGVTWSAGRRLTWALDWPGNPAIAVGPTGHLHVVWSRYSAHGSEEIFYKKSTDGGATWSADKILTWNAHTFEYPNIAVDAFDNPHVLWVYLYFEDRYEWFEMTDIFFKKSSDGGASWTTRKRIFTEEDTWCYDLPIVVDHAGDIHIAWWNDQFGGLFYRKSQDGGATWTRIKSIVGMFCPAALAAIAVDSSDNLDVVWSDGTTGNAEIFGRRYIK